MGAILLVAVLASSPTVLRIDLEDALRTSSRTSTPLEPLVVLVKAPADWVSGSTLTRTDGVKRLAATKSGGETESTNSNAVKSCVLSVQREEAHRHGQRVRHGERGAGARRRRHQRRAPAEPCQG